MTRNSSALPVLDVGVLGSVNRDTIEHADGRIEHGLGGVLFTACALAHLGGGALRVWLLARAHDELASRLRQRMGHVPGLYLEGLFEISDPGYRCHITYDGLGGKTEVLSGDVAPLTLAELSPFLPRLHALVVNFITGFELDVGTLAAMGERVDGPLLVDVHSLTLGRRADGTRFPRPPADIHRWLAPADVVQMNAEEARILGAPGGDGTAGLLDWATSLLDRGPSAVIITRGAAGAIAAAREPDGSVLHLDQAAYPVDPVQELDPTGCGDVFLAALTTARIRGADLHTTLEQASRAAARNCLLTGIDELHRLTP
ncbi:MAG: PfkB family carbohydrate kinase [Candidatus Latescibacterota bacterium]